MIGIYKITINSKIYVGSSFDILRRRTQHKSDLKRQRHDNPYLQAAYNKYGEFRFEVIKVFQNITDEELRKEEKYYKELLNAEYNIQDPETNFLRKKVYQFNLQGELINQFDSCSEAAQALNISTSNIMHAAQENEKVTRTAGGYFWRYTPECIFNPDKRTKPIHVYNIEGYYIKTFNTFKECAESLDISVDIINRIHRGLSASSKGFRFSLKKVDKLDNSQLLKIKQGYPVVQISADGKNKIKVWNTAAEAGRYFKCKSYEITQACQKNRKAKGYRWTRLGTKLSELLEYPEDYLATTQLETTNVNA